MKNKLSLIIITAGLITFSGCKDFLDVNTNPNGPEKVTPNLYLSPIQHLMAESQQQDGRYLGRYIQNWAVNSAADVWDRHGYNVAPSDNGSQIFREVYFGIGQNLVDMMTLAEAEQRWDLLGVGYVIKAWCFQTLTDVSGEIIIKDAFDINKRQFSYDSQEFAYQEVRRLLQQGINHLKRTDGAVSSSFLGRTDRIYNGDRDKWLKFAYGMMAVNLSHLTNKTALYNPAKVIAYVDSSFVSNADDALMPYANSTTDLPPATNFFGPKRIPNALGNNLIPTLRQTNFIVNLMKGIHWGNVVDPRLPKMLAPATDGQYRGIEPNLGFGALTTTQRPHTLYGTEGTPDANKPTKYLFDDKNKFPILTYSMLQFIKAEAAYRNNEKGKALTAFRNGVSSHIDFVNARNLETGGTGSAFTPITDTEKATFMSSTAIPTNEANLTLSMIMSQKYIAQFGWAFVETWADLRRYNYTDADPATGQQVFPGFQLPATIFADNGGKVVERVRTRYASEYVWNRDELDKIGGLAADFHTKPMWFTEP